jgi:hypothetical protein
MVNLVPTSAFQAATAAPSGNGFFDSGGFLNKAGEQLLDFAGLYGDYEIAKLKAEASADRVRPNPEVEASQNRAGIGMSPQELAQWVKQPDNRLPLYIIGGVAAAGVIAAMLIASNRKG